MEQQIKEKVKSLPKSSGVYIMKNSKDEIIYIGKAKNLKNRVSQYFQNTKKQIKVQTMVENISNFEYILTPSELDAFILENTLIKKHQPFFNILLKDGKQYPYIRVNPHDDYPRFCVVRKVKKDGARYFGPYFGKINAYELLKTINTAYAIRTCNKEFKIRKKTRPCLNYSLGLCSGPCCDKISKEDYKILVHRAMNFLNGNEKEILQILENKMKIASENENFETAISLRDRILMIKELSKKAVVDLAKSAEFDIFAAVQSQEFVVINSTIVRAGKLLSSQNFIISQASGNLEEDFSTFLLQYYNNKLVPKNILTNLTIDFNLVENALSVLKGASVSFSVPERGPKRNLVVMAQKNAENFIKKELLKEKEEVYLNMVSALKLGLNLHQLPNRIECYDISHISGTNKVGSMVVFGFGKPLKSDYRKFKIKTVEGNNDFASLSEVLSRRVLEFEKKTDSSFKKFPDLIVIDGGKGQLSSVIDVLSKTSFKDVPIISLAKKLEEVFAVNSKSPIIFKKGSPELCLLQNIRDEAHRFAITFHRTLRSKNMIS